MSDDEVRVFETCINYSKTSEDYFVVPCGLVR